GVRHTLELLEDPSLNKEELLRISARFKKMFDSSRGRPKDKYTDRKRDFALTIEFVVENYCSFSKEGQAEWRKSVKIAHAHLVKEIETLRQEKILEDITEKNTKENAKIKCDNRRGIKRKQEDFEGTENRHNEKARFFYKKRVKKMLPKEKRVSFSENVPA